MSGNSTTVKFTNYSYTFTVWLPELIISLGFSQTKYVFLGSLISVEHLHPTSRGKSFKSHRQFMWLPQRPAFSSLYYQVFKPCLSGARLKLLSWTNAQA